MGLGRRLVVFLVCLCICSQLEAQNLQVGFYSQSCPGAESIVREETMRALAGDIGLAASLLRMHFHDCFVRGCEGSVLLDSTPGSPAEKDSPANNPSLRGYEVIDVAKSRLEAICSGVVSCADIIAFAARDSVESTGGPRYSVPAGRRDGRVSLSYEASAANIPPPTFNLTELTQLFASKGLTQEDLVTLSGSHTIGRSHCPAFTNRLYDFNETTSRDPSLDPTYAEQLQQACPRGVDNPNTVVPMDPPSPALFDSSYFRGLLANRGLFTSDAALLSDPNTLALVRAYANDDDLFKRQFAVSMVRMGNIGVLTGATGEIRRNCRVVNGMSGYLALRVVF